MSQALEGIRVIDFTHDQAGPSYCPGFSRRLSSIVAVFVREHVTSSPRVPPGWISRLRHGLPYRRAFSALDPAPLA